MAIKRTMAWVSGSRGAVSAPGKKPKEAVPYASKPKPRSVDPGKVEARIEEFVKGTKAGPAWTCEQCGSTNDCKVHPCPACGADQEAQDGQEKAEKEGGASPP